MRLLLIGGAPGTGKSTVSAALADTLGAVLLSTDTLRREIATDPPHYDDESRQAVYRALLARAARALTDGKTVVADATWHTAEVRDLARECAVATSSVLYEFECRTPRALAVERAERRLQHGGGQSQVSGAVALMLAEQREVWPTAIPLDTSGSPLDALRSVARILASADTPTDDVEAGADA